MINARYSGIVDNTNRFVFHILGCGAIGSSAATQICRMGGTNFILYDYDVVDIVNIGVSQYNHDDIDKYKVDALTNHLQNINPSIAVDKFNEPFKERSLCSKISPLSRSSVIKNAVDFVFSIPLIIWFWIGLPPRNFGKFDSWIHTHL